MKNRKEIERLASETLSSIDDIQAAEVNEFIFTRIQNRLEARKASTRSANVPTLYRLSAVLLLLMLINLSGYYLLARGGNSKQALQKSSGIEAFASEYNLQQNTYNY